MNKNTLIWGTALILVVIAIYTTNNYEKNKDITNSVGPTTALLSPTIGLVSPTTTLVSPTVEATNGDTQQSTGNVSANKAIDFSLIDLDGKKISLSDYRGKNVYLNFFATWCPPCRGEMPDIEKIYEKYKDKDLVILAVDSGENKDVVKSFIEKNNYKFKVLLDTDQTVNQQYNITAIPVSYFIDKKGNVVASKVGAMGLSQMEQYIKMF